MKTKLNIQRRYTCEAAPEMEEIENTLLYVSNPSKREFNGFDILDKGIHKKYLRTYNCLNYPVPSVTEKE